MINTPPTCQSFRESFFYATAFVHISLYDHHGQLLHVVLGGCRRCLTMWHALPEYPTNMTFRYRMPSPSAPRCVAQSRSAYLVYLAYLIYVSFLPQVTAQS